MVNPLLAFADFIDADPTVRPSTFIAESFSALFVEGMARRKPGSKSTRAMESSFYDYAHLAVGAAYCDVFTCDGPTAECLADASAKIARQQPIVFRGDMAALVRALESA